MYLGYCDGGTKQRKLFSSMISNRLVKLFSDGDIPFWRCECERAAQRACKLT